MIEPASELTSPSSEFEKWVQDYALRFEPNFDEGTYLDCKAAFLAGMACVSAPSTPSDAEIDAAARQVAEDVKATGEHINELINEVAHRLIAKLFNSDGYGYGTINRTGKE